VDPKQREAELGLTGIQLDTELLGPGTLGLAGGFLDHSGRAAKAPAERGEQREVTAGEIARAELRRKQGEAVRRVGAGLEQVVPRVVQQIPAGPEIQLHRPEELAPPREEGAGADAAVEFVLAVLPHALHRFPEPVADVIPAARGAEVELSGAGVPGELQLA